MFRRCLLIILSIPPQASPRRHTHASYNIPPMQNDLAALIQAMYTALGMETTFSMRWGCSSRHRQRQKL